MNDVQIIIDRQLGNYSRFNYDNVLRRLVVNSEESFYGLQSASLPATFEQDPPIFACRFSEAPGYDHIVALANEDGRVAIQDTSTPKAASKLEGFQCHNNAVFDLVWRPLHMNFVTVSGDHTACLWDVGEAGPHRVLVFASHTRSVKTAAFRPREPCVFATGARDGRVLLWDVRAAPAAAAVLRPDDVLAAVHAAPSPRHRRPRPERAASVTGLAFRDDRTLVSCGECDGNIKVWDLRKSYGAYRREPLPMHSIPYCGSSARNGYTNLIVDEAGVRLYASCMDDVIYCFNVSTFNALPERRYVGHENSTFYIKTGLSPDGRYLVSGSSDKHAYVWNVRRSRPVARLAGHRAEVTCAAWGRAPDLRLVTCSDDARHMIWRVGREERSEHEDCAGRAERAPCDQQDTPLWGALERTPASARRTPAAPGSTGGDRVRHKASKRCLAELMGATRERDEDGAGKRPRTEEPRPADLKRRADCGEDGPPSKKERAETEAAPADFAYFSPKAGSSFMTPTKNYDKRTCKTLSPKSPSSASPPQVLLKTPSKDSPHKVRIVSFSTPTKNLPDFVMDGEAPHLRLMSPGKKKADTTDWLTRIVRERRGKENNDKHAAPTSPKEPPPRRNSLTDKTPRAQPKTRTLLKYFSVTRKE
ncbi:unnamed protein product [Danaus chrysippus]|uniref:(African queen) hypothetical protein n=1 Tax=Danaus chrysippus TaxID=151541 RepID=A0A8J2R6X7_9NEOP|nr:unnamed protein product [Danaus chrysippus]